MAKLVQQAARTAGIATEVGTHTGRSSVITTLWVDGGEALEDIARDVGHSQSSTTAGYVKRLGRTHYPLSDGTDVEILTFLDDHSRYALTVTAHQPVTGAVVVDVFQQAVERYGPPASTLTDNGMVFTTRLSGGRGGRNGFETELRRLGIHQKNSRPNHPTTCGKVERFQQTLKKWLRAQPTQPETLAQLQALLDTFVDHYNHRNHPENHNSPTPTEGSGCPGCPETSHG